MSLNVLVGDNGIISNAQKSSLTQELASMKEDLEMNRAALDAASFEQYGEKADFSVYVTGEDVKNYIPSIPDKYIGKVAIFDGEMVLVGDNLSEEEKQTAEQVGIKTMEDTDYNYMLEMKYLELAVINHKDDLAKIGTELGKTDNPYETIAGINYGLGWYKISTQSELTNLGITTEQMSYMTHIPYIVKYSTGAVQSIAGKMMYAGTSNEIWKYTFNYKGETNGIVVSNLLSAATNSSTKTATKFGELVPNHTYAKSGTTSGIIENYYVDDYTYDLDGGVVLTEKTNILNLPIDQTKPINQKYSFSITIKCDISNAENSVPTKQAIHPKEECLLAISPLTNYYVTRVGVYKGYIILYSFCEAISDGYPTSEYSKNGITAIDASQFSNKYLNIQVTSEAKGKTKIYFNGQLINEVNSGSYDNLKYDYCTIGDIRPGRGAKYVGNVYNFALYGEVLTDEEIAQNWNYVKNELGINEAGEKIN
ncbi:MAG: hypothetical protein IJ867_00655 [Clostridia bacterium]|nr:hypothetical protein [Clostridia bacterium]